MRSNDYIDEPYVYTREEELTLSIELRKKRYIARLEEELLRYQSLLTSTDFSEGFISGELKRTARDLRKPIGN